MGEMHAECAAAPLLRESIAIPPVVWSNGRNLTVYFDGPLRTLQRDRLGLDVNLGGRGCMIAFVGLGEPIATSPETAVYELPKTNIVIKRGDKVRLLAIGAHRHAVECENQSTVEAEGYDARGPQADRERHPEPENPQPKTRELVINLKLDRAQARREVRSLMIEQITMHSGKSWAEAEAYYDDMKRKQAEARERAENPDRSEAPPTQVLTTFASLQHPALYAAVVTSPDTVYLAEAVQRILDTPLSEGADRTRAMIKRLSSLADEISDLICVEDIAVRYLGEAASVCRVASFIHRRGVFQHDSALWAEFLRAIG